MKKLFFIFIVVAIFSSCDKDQQVNKDLSSNSNIKPAAAPPSSGTACAIVSNLAWHRAIQFKPSGGLCNCGFCFGICRIDPDGPFIGGGNSIIFISSDLTYARIFSLKSLEDDDEFMIDYDIDVEISSDDYDFSEEIRFEKGEYDYIPETDEIDFNDETYTTYGSVDINISIL